MSHRKLMADTLAGLARGIFLAVIAAGVIESSFQQLNAVAGETLFLLACISGVIYTLAHVVLLKDQNDGNT